MDLLTTGKTLQAGTMNAQTAAVAAALVTVGELEKNSRQIYGRFREQADYLRWRTHLLGAREPFKPRTALPLLARHTQGRSAPVAEAMPATEVAAEIAALPANSLLVRSGDLEVYLARATQIPNALRELGRLREITFRAAGEGTGKPLDIDEFDSHYLHLFLWNLRAQELVGAYRLAPTDVVRMRHGVLIVGGEDHKSGQADDTVQRHERLERWVRERFPMIEAVEFAWGGQVMETIDYVAFIGRNPKYKILFGPVSISNQYQAVSRELIMSFLERYAILRDWTGLVRNRHALRERFLNGARRPALPNAGFDIEDLSTVVSDIEQRQTAVPVLLRQYLRLGGKLLGFNVDPEFANALDGLILVDLTKTEPKLLERYLGRTEATAFLEFQKGKMEQHNGTH